MCHAVWQVSLELAWTQASRASIVRDLSSLVMAFEREILHAKVALENIRKGQVSSFFHWLNM